MTLRETIIAELQSTEWVAVASMRRIAKKAHGGLNFDATLDELTRDGTVEYHVRVTAGVGWSKTKKIPMLRLRQP
jgi:hypothetical protein